MAASRTAPEDSLAAVKSRIGPLHALPAVLAELGVAPRWAMRQAHIPESLLDDPDNRISQADVCRLLAHCVTITGRNDFGLLVGARASLADFGTLGELMRHATTVGEALRMLIGHLHFFDRVGIPVLFRIESSNVFLGYSLQDPAMSGTGPLQDTAIAVAFRMMRELCGPVWRPVAVQFSHRRPGSVLPYRRVFGPGVRFDAEFSGLFFDSGWLEHRISGADPVRWSRLNRALQHAEAGESISLSEEVRCVLHGLLAGGAVSAASVAQLFGVSERTLRQRLHREGTSLQQLLNATRFELACHLLEGTALSVSEIATALCYADPAVFSRAFHGWAGMSPRQWRTANRKQ